MGRLKLDLKPVGPWRGTVEEHNAYYREEYSEGFWAEKLAPCACGFHEPEMLCICWPEHRSPKHGKERLGAHYRREHEKALRAKREFPWPVHENAGVGWCRWCGKEIINPKTGQRHKQRTWCPDGGCLRTYNLHTFHLAQRRFLVKRDGEGCKKCGAPCCEVDHVIPLGAAWEAFPEPDRRRWFFSPRNLQLLCGDCHREKTTDDVAFIRACQRNGPQWAKSEVLRRLNDAGLLRLRTGGNPCSATE